MARHSRKDEVSWRKQQNVESRMSEPVSSEISVEKLLWSFLTSVSRALDLSYSGIMSHHMRVAVVTAKIGEALGFSKEETTQACQAALIHDLGAKTWGERAKLHQFEVASPFEHAIDGYRILMSACGGEDISDEDRTESQKLLLPYARIILHHHDRWGGGNLTSAQGESIPIQSRMIHAADRLVVLLDDSRPLNAQSEEILAALARYAGSVFDPSIVDTIKKLAKRESFWFDLEERFLAHSLAAFAPEGFAGGSAATGGGPSVFSLSSLDTLENLARVFAEVVDRRSPYTSAHSIVVGECSLMLARCMGLDELTCRELRIAGLLHDLGKMGVPEGILNKRGALTDEETCLMRRHAYLTYQLLRSIPGFERISRWASYHHERLDGEGYPFRLQAKDLPLEARIIAVCDVYAALSEDRPYRRGLPRDEVQRILNKMAREGALDPDVVNVAKEALWGAFDLVAATGSQIAGT